MLGKSEFSVDLRGLAQNMPSIITSKIMIVASFKVQITLLKFSTISPLSVVEDKAGLHDYLAVLGSCFGLRLLVSCFSLPRF